MPAGLSVLDTYIKSFSGYFYQLAGRFAYLSDPYSYSAVSTIISEPDLRGHRGGNVQDLL